MKIPVNLFRYRGMKPLLYILLFFMFSCHSNDSAHQDAPTKELSATELKPRSWSHSRDWWCSEGKFKCTTKLHSAEGVDTVNYAEAVVWNDVDTVLIKRVNIDTLQALMNRFANSSQQDVIDITGYSIADIIPMSGIRNYNTFYISRLTHVNKQDVYLAFAIKVFHSRRRGKIWFFGVNRDGGRYFKAKEECAFQKFET